MRKPRLERRPSIVDNDSYSDSEVDLEGDPTLEASLPEFSLVNKVDRKPSIIIEKRQWQSPRERLEAELRKLDGFWSFKPIPRDTGFVRQRQPRTALSPASSPSCSEVYPPSSLSPLEVTHYQYGFSGENANSSEGWPEPHSTTGLVGLGPAPKYPRSRLAIGLRDLPGPLGAFGRLGVLDKYSSDSVGGGLSQEEIVAKGHSSEIIYMETGKFKAVKRGGHAKAKITVGGGFGMK